MRNIIERFCLWTLKRIGAEIFIVPSEMAPYMGEIRALCREEEPLKHGSTDVLGDSWLKFRRVATKMKKTYPTLNKRALFKAVIVCSDSIRS